MSTNTTNYKLIKPNEEDYYNIEDFNNNSDILDSELKKVSDRAEVLEKNLYNPNLLINSNFRVSELINQRGESLYDFENYNGSYIFDMFKMYKPGNGRGDVDLSGE